MQDSFLEKLADIALKFKALEDELSSGSLSADRLVKVSKERADIEEIVMTYNRYLQNVKDSKDAENMMRNEPDPELSKMAKEEYSELTEVSQSLEKKLILLNLPQDPLDNKNVIVEIRAGTGGEEAALFVSDLYRMYNRYADVKKWRIENLNSNPASAGGFKEIVFLLSGQKVYSAMKFESGTHRVQRVPATESQGRVNTSACTVAVLPEADDIEEVEIIPSDLEIDTFRASGSGGQHVNTTDSAIRIHHKPSGLVVECQDERSQHKNKDRALKVLKARLFEHEQQQQNNERSADRKSQVGSGDRSERIRTYNYPQGRLTDHRINLTLYRLEALMNGEIGEVIDALGANYQAELLKKEGEQVF